MEIDEGKKQFKKEKAAQIPRNDEGEFVTEYITPHKHEDPVAKVFEKNVHYSRKQDDLLDIRVGNPLQRIIDLLEQIKKQKAFSFSLKGSLGIAGVFLTLSIFGIFGGGKILCDKGIQSEVGVIKALNIYQIESANTIPVISNFMEFFKPRTSHQRIVLVKSDNLVIDLPYVPNVDVFKHNNSQVVATGNYDSCSQSLTVKEQAAIEPY